MAKANIGQGEMAEKVIFVKRTEAEAAEKMEARGKVTILCEKVKVEEATSERLTKMEASVASIHKRLDDLDTWVISIFRSVGIIETYMCSIMKKLDEDKDKDKDKDVDLDIDVDTDTDADIPTDEISG